MLTPSHLEAPPASIRRSKRLLLRTKALPEVSGAVAEFEAAAASYENLYDQWIEARRGLLIARREQRQAEEALDRQLRGVGLAIQTASGGHRKSEVLRKYFPSGWGTTLELPAEKSLPIAAGLIGALADETSADIVVRREPLTAARDRLLIVTEATKAKADALGLAKANLEEGKLTWWKAHNAFYFAVRSTYSDRRGFVESLFRVNGRRKSDEEETPDEGDTRDSEETDGEAIGGEPQGSPTGSPAAVPAPAIALVPSQVTEVPARGSPEPVETLSGTAT